MHVVLLTSHLWEFNGPSRLWHPENPRHHTFLQAQLEATVPLATWLHLHSECPQVFRKYAVHLQSDTAIHCVLGQILWSRGPCHQFWAVCIELQLLLGPFLPFEKLPQWILQPAKLADSILETGEKPEIVAALWTSSLSQSSASISTLAYVHRGTSWS